MIAMLKTGHNLSRDEIRQRYEALTGLGSLGSEFRRLVIEMAGPLTGRRVLDVGAGRGELMVDLKNAGARSVWGIDFSAPRLVALALHGDPCLHMTVADLGGDLPFRTASFDFVVSTEVIEHLKDPGHCLDEIQRVLKPDGFGIFSIPNGTGFGPFLRVAPLIRGRWLRQKLLPYEYPGNTAQPIDTCFEYQEILTLFTSRGWRIEAQRGYRYLRFLQLLPIVRGLYGRVRLRVEHALERKGKYRYAYNLVLRCRPRLGARSR